MDISKPLKKQKRQVRNAKSQMRGYVGEQKYRTSRAQEGYVVKRTGKGSDYEERKVDPWTGRLGPKTLVEVKSGPTAHLSKLQKKTRKKSKRYRVERQSGNWL